MKLVLWNDFVEASRLKIDFSTASGCAGHTNDKKRKISEMY